MSFKTLLEEVEKNTEREKRLDDLSFSENPGVYLIYKDQKVIYIGQSENLKKRFRKHLSTSESTRGSTLRRLLVKEHDVEPQKTREWILKNCNISVIELSDDTIDLR
ncbi:MAG: GIY-YIG nuclease family protein [Candidatus Thorarchaeota archaeon]